MNKNKLVIQMLPDYIRGKLTDEDKIFVEKELCSSDILRREKEKTEQYLRNLENLGTEEIKDDFLDRVHQKIESRKRTSFLGLPKFSLEITGLLVAVSLIVVIYNPFSEHSITHSNSYITKDFTDAVPSPQTPVKTVSEPEIYNEHKVEDVKIGQEPERDKKVKSVKKSERYTAGTVSKPKRAPVIKEETRVAPAAELQSPPVEKLRDDADQSGAKVSSAMSPVAQRNAAENHIVSTVKTVSLIWNINSQVAGELSSAPAAAPEEMYKIARGPRSSRKERSARVEMEMRSDDKRELAGESNTVQEEYLFNVIALCEGTFRKIEENGSIIYRLTIRSSKMRQFVEKLQLKGTVIGMVQDADVDQDINYTVELRIQ